jgi:hypothetical protein
MRRFCYLNLLSLAIGLLASSLSLVNGQPPAGVTFTYQLIILGDTNPVTGNLNYVPGQNLTVQVFLTQTGGASSYLASEGGLFQGGVRMTYGTPTGTQGILTVPSVNNIVLNTTTANPPGTSSFNDVSNSNATRQNNIDFAQFSPSTDASYGVLPDAVGRILLGEVTFATNSAGGTTNLVLTDIPPTAFTDNLTLSGTNLDPAISPATFAVTPIPEPIYAVGLCTIALLLWRRRGQW